MGLSFLPAPRCGHPLLSGKVVVQSGSPFALHPYCSLRFATPLDTSWKFLTSLLSRSLPIQTASLFFQYPSSESTVTAHRTASAWVVKGRFTAGCCQHCCQTLIFIPVCCAFRGVPQIGFEFGAPGGNRTRDPRFRKPLLYPLSYRGLMAEFKPKQTVKRQTEGRVLLGQWQSISSRTPYECKC